MAAVGIVVMAVAVFGVLGLAASLVTRLAGLLVRLGVRGVAGAAVIATVMGALR